MEQLTCLHAQSWPFEDPSRRKSDIPEAKGWRVVSCPLIAHRKRGVWGKTVGVGHEGWTRRSRVGRGRPVVGLGG
jgi:hypothetical protein